MRSRQLCIVGVMALTQACSGKNRPFGAETSGGSSSEIADLNGAGEGSDGEFIDPASVVAPPGASQPSPEAPFPVGGVEPAGSLVDPATISCTGDAGVCSSDADAGATACVPTGPRDCTSELDNDCDGQPDNTVDAVCVCTPDSVSPCDEHPGLDGRGQCRPGSRTCLLGEGNLTTNWGECVGSVGPGEQDSCAVVGDDSNCDGTNNGGCPCIEGETRSCGPDTEAGTCQ